jgi:hypothetical protein
MFSSAGVSLLVISCAIVSVRALLPEAAMSSPLLGKMGELHQKVCSSPPEKQIKAEACCLIAEFMGDKLAAKCKDEVFGPVEKRIAVRCSGEMNKDLGEEKQKDISKKLMECAKKEDKEVDQKYEKFQKMTTDDWTKVFQKNINCTEAALA